MYCHLLLDFPVVSETRFTLPHKWNYSHLCPSITTKSSNDSYALSYNILKVIEYVLSKESNNWVLSYFDPWTALDSSRLSAYKYSASIYKQRSVSIIRNNINCIYGMDSISSVIT